MYKLLVSICLVGLLAGCGGNVKKITCTGNDWADIGYTTATNGLHVRTFDKYRDQCGKNLEEGAMEHYLEGYTKGVLEYCTYENGYALGLKNQPNENSCPVEIRSNFKKGHHAGLSEFKYKMQQLTHESDKAEKQSIKNAADISAER